jgi:hypothetical protein
MPPARDDLPRSRRPGPGSYGSRETAMAEPRPLRLRDNGMRVLNDRISAQVRPAASRSEPGLPNRKPVRAFQDPELAPGPGEGVLSVLVESTDLAPVIAVDGIPVAVGNGQLDLVLLAGPHMVEAQSMSTLDPVAVDVADGGRHRLQYFEHWPAGHRVLGDLPETHEFIPTNAGCWSWLAMTSTICCLPMSAAMTLFPSEDWHWISGIILGALAVVLIATGIPLWRKAKAKYQRDLTAQRQSLAREPVPHGPDAVFLGDNPTAPPPLPIGAAAIDLHLTCGRHLWAGGRTAAHGSFLARAWTPAPRVRIDGVEQPASWGHWRYHVPPGAHQITVVTDGRPANLDIPDRHTGRPGKQRELTVETQAGQTITLTAEAHVYAVWRPATGEIESFEPRLWLESA